MKKWVIAGLSVVFFSGARAETVTNLTVIDGTFVNGAFSGDGQGLTNIPVTAVVNSNNMVSLDPDDYAAALGGAGNKATGWGATIPGGMFNDATGNSTFAAGYKAQATNTGAFVWSDFSQTNEFASITNNEFAIRASGGLRLVAGRYIGNGSGLTNLDASALTGTIDAKRLPTSGSWDVGNLTISNLTVSGASVGGNVAEMTNLILNGETLGQVISNLQQQATAESHSASVSRGDVTALIGNTLNSYVVVNGVRLIFNDERGYLWSNPTNNGHIIQFGNLPPDYLNEGWLLSYDDSATAVAVNTNFNGTIFPPLAGWVDANGTATNLNIECYPGTLAREEGERIAADATKVSTNDIEQTVSTNATKVPSSAAVGEAIAAAINGSGMVAVSNLSTSLTNTQGDVMTLVGDITKSYVLVGGEVYNYAGIELGRPWYRNSASDAIYYTTADDEAGHYEGWWNDFIIGGFYSFSSSYLPPSAPAFVTEFHSGAMAVEETARIAGDTTKVSTNDIEQIVSTNTAKIPSSAAVKAALAALPSSGITTNNISQWNNVTNALLVNGTQAMQANLNMGGRSITNVLNLTVQGVLSGNGYGLTNLPVSPELTNEIAARIAADALKFDKTGGTLTGGLKITLPGYGTVVDMFNNAQGNINFGQGAGTNSTGARLSNLGNYAGMGSSGTNQFNVGESAGSFSRGYQAYNFGVASGSNSSGNYQTSLGRSAGSRGTNDYYLYIENWKVAPTSTAETLNGAFVLNGDSGELWLGRPSAQTHLRGTVTGDGSGLTNLFAQPELAAFVATITNSPSATITTNQIASWNSGGALAQSVQISTGAVNITTNLSIQGTISGNGSGLSSVAAGGNSGELQFNENGVLAGNTNYFIHPAEQNLSFHGHEGNISRAYNSKIISDETLIYSLRNEDGTAVFRLRQEGQDAIRLSGDGNAYIAGNLQLNGQLVGDGAGLTNLPVQAQVNALSATISNSPFATITTNQIASWNSGGALAGSVQISTGMVSITTNLMVQGILSGNGSGLTNLSESDPVFASAVEQTVSTNATKVPSSAAVYSVLETKASTQAIEQAISSANSLSTQLMNTQGDMTSLIGVLSNSYVIVTGADGPDGGNGKASFFGMSNGRPQFEGTTSVRYAINEDVYGDMSTIYTGWLVGGVLIDPSGCKGFLPPYTNTFIDMYDAVNVTIEFHSGTLADEETSRIAGDAAAVQAAIAVAMNSRIGNISNSYVVLDGVPIKFSGMSSGRPCYSTITNEAVYEIVPTASGWELSAGMNELWYLNASMTYLPPLFGWLTYIGEPVSPTIEFHSGDEGLEEAARIAADAAKISKNDIEQIVSMSADKVPSSAAVQTAISAIPAAGITTNDISNWNSGNVTNALLVNGTQAMQADLNMGGHSITNVLNLTVQGVLSGNGIGLTNLPVSPELTNEIAARIAADTNKLDKTGGTLTGVLVAATNVTVQGAFTALYIPPQGDLSMGSFTNGLSQ